MMIAMVQLDYMLAACLRGQDHEIWRISLADMEGNYVTLKDFPINCKFLLVMLKYYLSLKK